MADEHASGKLSGQRNWVSLIPFGLHQQHPNNYGSSGNCVGLHVCPIRARHDQGMIKEVEQIAGLRQIVTRGRKRNVVRVDLVRGIAIKPARAD